MTPLPDSARTLIESGRLVHCVTVNRNGSPQLSGVWIGLDGDEIVMAHLPENAKVRNLRRDPRIAGVAADTEFPLPPDPPAGFVVRIAVDRIGGVGPWTG